MGGTTMDKFYDGLQTVPKLISDLALSVAEAQRRLDHDYIENLSEFLRLVSSLKIDASSQSILALFRSMAPGRYQFTETTVEVRADLQMGSASEFMVDGNSAVKAAVFAVAVNASYSRRSAYDAQSAAVIRTVLNSVPADPGVMDKLLARAGETPHAAGPGSPRYKQLAEAFESLRNLAAATALPPAGEPAKSL